MLNKLQIKLVQMAVKQAGIRQPKCDGRYRMLLGQYRQPNGSPVTSCKQLNNWQLEDLLAICEAHGWRLPGKEETHFRDKVAKSVHSDIASFAQQSAIKNLSGDLGYSDEHLANFLRRQTGGIGSDTAVSSVCSLSHRQAWGVIEALKIIIGKETGKRYSNLNDIKEDFSKEATDGKACQVN